MDDLKIERKNAKDYQLDHIVPLSLGGNPIEPENLQLQSYFGDNNAHDKDALEHRIHRDVCEHRLSLKDGQKMFLDDNWKNIKK